MTDLTLSRRDFLKGCCATAAVGAVGPTMLFSSPAHAGVNPYDTIVHVFLRGGIDGLNLVVPIAGEDRTFYEQARPNLSIAATGAYSALPLTLGNGAQTGFGLHPSASGLHDLWNDSKLAIVHNCGLLTTVTRSHFDAQLYLDLGTPGQQGGGSGWLTRAWSSHPNPSGTETMPTLAVNSRTPANLLGSTAGIAMASPTDFALNSGAWQWQMARTGSPAGFQGVNETIAKMWEGRARIEQDGARANNALKVIAQQPYGALPAGWPTSNFARQLWTVAQSIRFNLGVRYATLDLGGWDTHENQGTAGSGYNFYQNKIAELSQALSAFYAELALGGEAPRVTVVVQSEFGRRVRQNGSYGTDHGYGNPLLVLGAPVNGRRFHGSWLGLNPDVLQPYFGDVPVTTDYRRVFSELLIRRMGNNRLSTVFPGYGGYSPLGVVQGADMTPQITSVDQPQGVARLPHHPQPRVGESLQVDAADVPTPDWQKRGKVERILIRRGL
ncbi:MAG: DUF1501 domain-containing protein [Pseudomonadota bacterium]|nr:DUF1501 domain-containing protein [Pseudomonadota bacterium]